MKRVFTSVFVSFLSLAAIGLPAAAQWSQFRGPNGSGVDATHGISH
jgi:hypothetical protein